MIKLLKIALGIALLATIGCQQNPTTVGQYGYPNQPGMRPGQIPPQVASSNIELERRVNDLDANNRDLHSQLAQSQKQAQFLQDEIKLLQGRLQETADQLQLVQQEKSQYAQRVEAFTASTQQRGGATIRPNNSLLASLSAAKLNIPGVEVKTEDDVIRILVPSDKVFQATGTQIQPSAYPMLDHIATAISTNYGDQRVAIEGHIDNTPGIGPATLHQMTSAQTLAVFQHFTDRNRLPANQFFTMAHGANHPRASNGTPLGRVQNRRIELVVYPDKFR